MSKGWAEIAAEHKKEMRQVMAEIWRRYDRIPDERKRQAMQLIESWFNDQLGYEELLRKLEQLAAES